MEHNENNYLSHYGILGQKWGVRRYQNKDGSLTDEGKKYYQKQVQDDIKNAKFKEDISSKVFRDIGADKKYLHEAHDILRKNHKVQKEITDQTEELFKDLRSRKNIHFYEAASEVAASVDYESGTDVDELTAHDFGYSGFHGVLDDGQQSPINAYSIYASKNNLETKVNDLQVRSIDSYKWSDEDAAEKIINAFTDVGIDDIPVYEKHPTILASKRIIDALNDVYYDDWNYTNGGWYLEAASHAKSFSDKDKSNIDKSLKYVSKIKDAGDQNTWWYVSEAVENLGLSSTKLKNLTDSDWKRINAEIKDLKENDL